MTDDDTQLELSESEKEGLRAAAKIVLLERQLSELQETLEMLEEDVPALLEEIRAAAQSANAEALIKPAHTLKGMFGNFFAEKAERAARELEMMGREARLANVESAIDTLQCESDRLIEALKIFVQNKEN